MKNLVGLLFIIFIVSCSNDDSDSIQLNKAKLSGDWVLTDMYTNQAIDFNGDGNFTTAIYEYLPVTCYLDDIMRLISIDDEDIYQTIENTVTCDSNTPETIKTEHYWFYVEDDNTLSLGQSDFFTSYDITFFNYNSLFLRRVIDYSDDGSAIYYYYKYEKL